MGDSQISVAAEGGAGVIYTDSPDALLTTSPGRSRSQTAVNLSDITAFTAVTDGSIVIGTDTVTGIDLSGATSINDVVNTMTTAIHAAGLTTYNITLTFVNPSFYIAIVHTDGGIPVIGDASLGAITGLNNPVVETLFSDPTAPIQLNLGDFQNIRLSGISFTGQSWFTSTNVFRSGNEITAWMFGLSNTGAWNTMLDTSSSEVIVGEVIAYNVAYIQIKLTPAGLLTWERHPNVATWPSGLVPRLSHILVGGM